MNVLIFGGTTEGDRLAKTLSDAGHAITLSVATTYAEKVFRNEFIEILVGRKNEQEMILLLKSRAFDVVVDATHPFADQATRNIRRACKATNTDYRRLSRSKSGRHAEVAHVAGAEDAVDLLSRESGNIFLAIGSKELEPFTRLDNFASRCTVRILPMLESLRKVMDLGFHPSRIVCMQGPFSVEMNRAMFETADAKFLVTKDSGDAGGVEEKIIAASACDCRTIVLERPVEENGLSFEKMCAAFHVPSGRERKDSDHFSYFPLFFNLKCKRILVVGGGKVASRRIGILLRFGAEIRLVSPSLTDELEKRAARNELSHLKRKYKAGDVEGIAPFLTIAATDCRETNAAVAREAESLGLPVIVSDCRERCDCYFPAIAENETLLAGVISKDGDHRAVRNIVEQIRRLFNDTKIP